jgi:hypothetical protein
MWVVRLIVVWMTSCSPPPVILPPYSIRRPAFSRGVQEVRLFFETFWSAFCRIQSDRAQHLKRRRDVHWRRVALVTVGTRFRAERRATGLGKVTTGAGENLPLCQDSDRQKSYRVPSLPSRWVLTRPTDTQPTGARQSRPLLPHRGRRALQLTRASRR